MAAFLRVGQRIINLDLVTDVRLNEKQVNVHLAAPDKDGDARRVVFKDDEARQLTEWFGQNARDVAVENNPQGFSLSHDRR